ncbi:ABC transporter substrate-binding protein [Pseudoclavibacter endophyticus]|uniref:Transporter substrate-binding domain-containing protein n=1 Tax=Pseudoclavibacter endophyticus TaxID=1778590 RepID=A0A6H9WKX0_9MICO|nr:transporter substrate-binding domain-containing protein [Pseudoclavibacter endophyticus]KAB1648152.1 transporter substrate-binding domain-containing protein [Pseudoclavibacter endophyticus]GGA70169.1 ABC transporter substrate-binding protein [Pseudoclavibacter endophyticus]
MLSRSFSFRGAAAVAGAALVVISIAGCTPASEVDGADTPDEPLLSPPAISEAGVLPVCTALGLAAMPLFYFDEAQEPQGIEIDMARDIANRLGLEYRAVSTQFPSLVPSLEAEQCDLVMGSLFITEERQEVVDFVPYLLSGSGLLVRSDDEDAVSEFGPELCGQRVGTLTGTSASAALKAFDECDAGNELVLTEIDSAATGRQMLLNDQLDVLSLSMADMYYMEAESQGALRVAGEPFETFDIGIAVRKDSTELKAAVEQAVEDMVADGTYDGILASESLEAISYFA